MNKVHELTKLYADAFLNFVPNPASISDAFRKSAEFGEKMSAVSLKAAQGSVEITNKWTAETFEQLGEITAAKEEVADYAKAAGEFASNSVEAATGHLAGLAEVAKNAQIESAEAFLAAGK